MQVKVEGCMKLELYVEKHFCSYSNGKLLHSNYVGLSCLTLPLSVSNRPFSIQKLNFIIPLPRFKMPTAQKKKTTKQQKQNKTRHVFVKHGYPWRQQSQNMAKISKSYILTTGACDVNVV